MNRLPGSVVLVIFLYVGSDPASTVHPKIYQELQAPPNIFEILATPKHIPHSVLSPYEKTLKCIEIFIPPKIFIFLKTPKNIEIQNFEPKNFK